MYLSRSIYWSEKDIFHLLLLIFEFHVKLRKHNDDIHDPLFAKIKNKYYGIAKINNIGTCAEESKEGYDPFN